MNQFEIAQDYVDAYIVTQAKTDFVNRALQYINPDNQILSLETTTYTSYTKLVRELLGSNLWDWIEWWLHEAEYGTKPSGFSIDNRQYETQGMTFYQFWEAINSHESN